MPLGDHDGATDESCTQLIIQSAQALSLAVHGSSRDLRNGLRMIRFARASECESEVKFRPCR